MYSQWPQIPRSDFQVGDAEAEPFFEGLWEGYRNAAQLWKAEHGDHGANM